MNIRFVMGTAILTVVFAHAKVQHVNTTAEFDSILKNNNFVVAKFGAEWCGPCRAAKPKYERVSDQFKDIIFIDIDVDKNEAIANRYDISGIPAFIYFKNGKEVRRHSGGSEGVDITIKNNISTLFGADRSTAVAQKQAPIKENVATAAVQGAENVVATTAKGAGEVVEKAGEAGGGVLDSIGNFFRSLFR